MTDAPCPPPREPSAPKIPTPPAACDTHCHVFGPASQFPYAADRSYTPPDQPLANYLHLLDTLGMTRGVLVQGSAHGRDNSAMLDALEREPQRLRGVCVADSEHAGRSNSKRMAFARRARACASIISSVADNCITAAACR